MRKDINDKNHCNLGIRSLYISYDGILEPLGQSQIMPYLRELSKKGINFELVTYEKKRHFQNKEMRETISQELQSHNIKWTKLHYHKRPFFFSTLFDIAVGLIISAIIVLKRKIKVIHARSYVVSSIALILKKVFRIKFIFDMRGFWADERVEGKLWKGKGILYQFVKFLEKQFLANAEEIVVLTEQARNILSSTGYTNVSVIPCCVETSKFRLDLDCRRDLRSRYGLRNKFIFVHTGSLEYWYMKAEMLDYFKVAKARIPNAHFLFLTSSNTDGILKSIFQKQLDKDDFSIVNVSFADMPKYLSMSDVGFFFITPVFSKLASSPTKFAEYLSCGLPIISNRGIGDIEDYTLENKIGVIVHDFNTAEYCRRLEELLNLLKQPDLKLRCRETACVNFALEHGVNRYYRIYSRLK